MPKPTPLRDLADRIRAHLVRFESDPEINAYSKWQIERAPSLKGLRPYYHAGARASGRYVGVSYISYQGWSYLTRDEAERYLAKLDAGFVGSHREALRERKR